MSELEMRSVVHGSQDYQLTIELRDEILRRPLGLVFTPEQLQEEADSFHLVGKISGKIVCCLVLKPLDKHRIQMRQLAVAEALQKRGYGRKLVAYAETFARNEGFTQMILHAREVSLGFYDKLDYQKIGEPFIEVGLQHWQMVRKV